MNYTDYNDYELLYLLKEDDSIQEILFEKYKPLISKISYKLYNNMTYLGLDISDLIQEGYIALDIASKTFNSDNNTTFFTYACKCVTNSILSKLRNHNSKKNNVLNSSISYNIDDKTYDNFKSNNNIDPLNIFLSKEFNNGFLKKLVGYEREVAICKVLGFSNNEISDMLSINNRSIYNTLTRIRKKYNMEYIG